MSGTSAALQWKLTRDTDAANWKLADTVKPGESADVGKTSSLSYALSAPTFVDVLPVSAKPAASGLDKPTTISAETFDGFSYAVKVGTASSDKYPVSVEVTGSFAKQRAMVKGEKPEDKTKADKDFETKLKGFQDKLAKEKKLEGRIYLVDKSLLDPLLKPREEFLNKPSPTPSPSPVAITSPSPMASGTPAAMPVIAPPATSTPAAVVPAPAPAPSQASVSPTVSVTTPAVSAPPLPSATAAAQAPSPIVTTPGPSAPKPAVTP